MVLYQTCSFSLIGSIFKATILVYAFLALPLFNVILKDFFFISATEKFPTWYNCLELCVTVRVVVFWDRAGHLNTSLWTVSACCRRSRQDMFLFSDVRKSHVQKCCDVRVGRCGGLSEP